jgi:hypothetical protein
MKWVGCLNHNLHHDTSESPRESPTATATTETETVTVSPAYIRLGLHSYDHWPQ